MNVIITNDKTSTTNGLTYRTIEAICGKKEAQILIADSYVNVICKNASHKAWRGMGKNFDTLQQAVENYKSSEMKAILSSINMVQPGQDSDTK